MFNFEQTLAAKAIEEQQLYDHGSDVGDRSPLLGGAATSVSSFDVASRYLVFLWHWCCLLSLTTLLTVCLCMAIVQMAMLRYRAILPCCRMQHAWHDLTFLLYVGRLQARIGLQNLKLAHLATTAAVHQVMHPSSCTAGALNPL